MLIFFQQLCLLLFLWLLKLVDGLMEIFSAISGITDVTYKGEKVNIIEFLAGDSTVSKRTRKREPFMQAVVAFLFYIVFLHKDDRNQGELLIFSIITDFIENITFWG